MVWWITMICIINLSYLSTIIIIHFYLFYITCFIILRKIFNSWYYLTRKFFPIIGYLSCYCWLYSLLSLLVFYQNNLLLYLLLQKLILLLNHLLFLTYLHFLSYSLHTHLLIVFHFQLYLSQKLYFLPYLPLDYFHLLLWKYLHYLQLFFSHLFVNSLHFLMEFCLVLYLNFHLLFFLLL